MDPWKTMSDMTLVEHEYQLYQEWCKIRDSYNFNKLSKRELEILFVDWLTHPNHYAREFAQKTLKLMLES